MVRLGHYHKKMNSCNRFLFLECDETGIYVIFSVANVTRCILPTEVVWAGTVCIRSLYFGLKQTTYLLVGYNEHI